MKIYPYEDSHLKIHVDMYKSCYLRSCYQDCLKYKVQGRCILKTLLNKE